MSADELVRDGERFAVEDLDPSAGRLLAEKVVVSGTAAVSVASLPLPAGAATEATLATRATEATLSSVSAKLGPGQALMAASVPVAIASDQSALHMATMEWHIARFGSWDGKTAWGHMIMGRRTAFSDTTNLHDIKEFASTVHLFPVMAGTEALEVVSSNPNDTIAGTGAQKVRVTYIRNDDSTQDTTDADMDGVTPVPLGAGVRAKSIQYAEVVQVGSNEVSAGNIHVRLVGGAATIYEQITAGGNRSLSGRYMVPSGHTAYICNWHASALNQDMDTRLRAKVHLDGTLSLTYEFVDTAYVGADMTFESKLPCVAVPAGGLIKLSTIPANAAGGSRCMGSFQIICVAD